MTFHKTILAFIACAALITPAKAVDYQQCNREVIQKKNDFNVGPKLVPLFVLGSGFEMAKVIGDSVTIIASAWLSSCNKAVAP